MKIEFDTAEVKAIILAEAQKYDPTLNTVSLGGSYSFTTATVTYVDPADKAREAAELAEYRIKRDAAILGGLPA